MPQRDAAPRSELDEVRLAVAAFVAVGADESVQRVITAVHRLSRRLNQWYDAQLMDLGVSSNDWAVISELARSSDGPLTPGHLATAANVAPSSMTHRLDRLAERGLIERSGDPNNRARVLVELTPAGGDLYATAIRDADLVESDVLASLDQTQVAELGNLLEQVIAGLDEAEGSTKRA